MKFYCIEVPTPYEQVPFRRYLETSKSALNERLLNILQRDAFGGNPMEFVGKPRVFTIDVPTPVKQSTVESLIRGEIYQYVVDENGEPDPQPNPWKPDNRRTLAQTLGQARAQTPVVPASKRLRPQTTENPVYEGKDEGPEVAPQFPGPDPEEDEGPTDADLEAQGQRSILDEEEEPLPF